MAHQPSWNKRAPIIALSTMLGLFFIFGLCLVFSGAWILPQAFRVGALSIRWYGVCLAIAAIVGYGLAMRRKEQYGISVERAEIIILVLLIAGFLGARLYHVISELSYYLEYPQFIFAIWRGGLSIFGAFIGGAIGVVVYLKFIDRLKQFSWEKFSNILDWLVPSLAIGQAIGRFGNLLNYEVYGQPTMLPWKMFVPFEFRSPLYATQAFFHPLFLYESLVCLFIALILLKWSSKLRGGKLFFLWLFLYNSVRFFLESMRIDSVMAGGLRINRLVALVLALLGLAAYIYLNKPDNVDQNPSTS